MSRDIRSYFTSLAAKKPTEAPKPAKVKRPIILSSDEEDSPKEKPKPVSHKQNSTKTSKKSNNSRIVSDSDDDSSRKQNHHSKSPKHKEKTLKPASVHDIFGKTPVKRVNIPPAPPKPEKKLELTIEDDDEFEASLMQVDTSAFDSLFAETKPADSNPSATNGKRKKVESDDDAQTKKRKILAEEQPKASKPQPTINESSKKCSTADKQPPKPELVIDKTTKKPAHTEPANPIEENIAKKREHIAAFMKYKQRGGARNPGSKLIPQGDPHCFNGLCFVITGVLDCLEREQVEDVIKMHGGRVVAALSRKTDFLLVGEEAGQSKLAKAEAMHTKLISEDELFNMIVERSTKKKKTASTSTKVNPPSESTKVPEKSPPKDDIPVPKREEKPPKPIAAVKVDTAAQVEIKKPAVEVQKPPVVSNPSSCGEAQALVDKYRPKTLKQIIGQQGDKSAAKKFHFWLTNWHKNHHGAAPKPVKASSWAKSEDGSIYKACLLSGPPGVGKTTTVQVVCAELGFDLLEFNASDTRSKKLLKEEVSGLLSNTTVKGYFTDRSQRKTSAKHVLVMDEVDGMAGNEDRGGLQELLALIKTTEIPIVCICNDRNHPKMRSLSNYTFDLRFTKPRLEQIRGAMKSLCCREDINISNEDLDRLIQSTNNDIRQVINHLAMLGGISGHKDEAKSGKLNKDLKLGPWEVVRKVFSAEEHKNMTFHDKSDLFFHDYNIAGLFVQENYLSVVPKAPKSELLDRMAAAADSLSMGDLVDKTIRGSMAWSLLPLQACYSSVIPGTVMSGFMSGMINFPMWLGRNSKRAKYDRLLQEITVHTRLATGASKEAINMEYLKPLRDGIVQPLVKNGSEGVDSALKIMNSYHLLREDLDGLIEVSLWPGQQDPFQPIESKVKAAFTRAYNKSGALTPFAVGAAPKKSSAAASQDEGFIEGDEEASVESDNDEDNLATDRMLVKTSKPTTAKASTSKASTSKASTSKASTATSTRGRGKAAAGAGKRGRGRGK